MFFWTGEKFILVLGKKWKIINTVRYWKHVVPREANYINENPNLQFLQDNALPHNTPIIQEALRVQNIRLLRWPPFSPDLNPIEPVGGNIYANS